MPADGGLGAHLVGDKITMGQRNLHVTKLLGEGGFSFVYLVKEIQDGTGLSSSLHVNPKDKKEAAAAVAAQGPEENPARRSSGSGGNAKGEKPLLVLKVTSIHSRSQRDIAEKEAKLLSRLSHPSIIKMYDTCYRTVAHTSQGKRGKEPPNAGKERPQHLILMEYCEGGHALDVCSKLAQSGQRFDLSTLIIAFGQICNAVSYLHAQRPPIVHRDLKPVNFLVKNGAYKLCDFGSAVFGHVDLRTPKARAEAEEVIQKTTTQMFRAPEMVDLYMAKKLTQATDVWALGCCLYSLAFLQNCFEEGSNLAILSRKYTIPEDNPYGDGLVELLDRMLTVDSKARADMTEVILCLSAVYSGRPLPPRQKRSRAKPETQEDAKPEEKPKEDKSARIGSFRTDGQGIQEPVYDPTKATEGKKLASNSVAARRKRAAASSALAPPAPAPSATPTDAAASDPLSFSSFTAGSDGKVSEIDFGADVAFGEMKGFETKGEGDENAKEFFGSFDSAAVGNPNADASNAFDAAFVAGAWGETAEPSPATEAATAAANKEDPPREAVEVAESQDQGDGGGAETSGDDRRNSDSGDRKDRSRRSRRGGGSSSGRTSSRPTSLEGGVEAMNVSDSGAGASGDPNSSKDPSKADRRSRSTRAEDEKERRRRRSGSRSRRKGRPSSRPDKSDGGGSAGEEPDKKPPKKDGSFQMKLFNK